MSKSCDQGATSRHNTRKEIITSSRILGEVLTMMQQYYTASGGAFRKRGLRTSVQLLWEIITSLRNMKTLDLVFKNTPVVYFNAEQLHWEPLMWVFARSQWWLSVIITIVSYWNNIIYAIVPLNIKHFIESLWVIKTQLSTSCCFFIRRLGKSSWSFKPSPPYPGLRAP